MRPLAVSLALVLAACGSPANSPDTGAPDDAGGDETSDGGDTTPDAGHVPDAGDTNDAGHGADAGGPSDAGESPDGGGEARCTVDACEAMIASCRIQLLEEPSNGAGGTLTRCGGDPPENAYEMYSERYCVPVCEARDDGPGFVQCMAAGQLQCLQGADGETGAVFTHCDELYPTVPKLQSCVNTCNSTRDTCDRTCASSNGTDWLGCMDCQLQCGIARANCRKACPAP